MPIRPVPLNACEKLNAALSEERTRFSRFVLLQTPPPKARPEKGVRPAVLPTDYLFRDRRRLGRFVKRAKLSLEDLKIRLPVVVPDPAPVRPGGGRVRVVDVAGLGQVSLSTGRLDDLQRIEGMRVLYPGLVQPAARSRPPAQIGLRRDLSQLITPIVRSVAHYAQLATEARSKAFWAVGLEFEQTWRSQGYLRGRLVRSLPLTPGEQIEIVVKTWDRRTERKTEVESIARQLSTELTGEEKWMLASKMLFSDQASAIVNPSAGANAGVSLPIDVITADLGGDLGLDGQFEDKLSQSTETATDYVHSQVLKAAESLSSSRTNTVELSHEAGEEIGRKQTIANTNRGRTLTYHYFEVLERFEVETRFDGAALHLMVPLPVPEITVEWVLCHECYLRKVLPCQELYRGIEGARTLATWETLKTLYPAVAVAPAEGRAAGAPTGASSFSGAVETLLARWAVVRDADLIPLAAPVSDGLLGNLALGGQIIAEGLAKLANDAAAGADAAIEAAGDLVEAGLNTAGEAIEGLAGAISDLGGAIFSGQARTFAAGGRQAPTGGPGTWLYREMAALAAPQIGDAFSYLEAAWPGVEALSGAERPVAELNVLTTFFAKLGSPAATFGKVDALFAGAAAAAVGAGGTVGAVAYGVVGGIAGGVIGAVGFGVSAIPGAAIGAAAGAVVGGTLGTTVVSGALALLVSLEAMGLADTSPDDAGLKDAALALKSQLDAALALAPATGLPGTTGTPGAQAAAAEAWRQQMRDIAEASVEFERLACHLEHDLLRYMQGLWSQWADHQIRAEAARHGIPSEVISARFVGFHGALGAVPVADLDWVKTSGKLDWTAVADKLAVRAKDQVRTETITLPTAGMTVEPSLGECEACEDFIQEHRKLDLENRRHEVELQAARARQAELEADRFAKRIAAGELDDPTPFEGAGVTVEVEGG